MKSVVSAKACKTMKSNLGVQHELIRYFLGVMDKCGEVKKCWRVGRGDGLDSTLDLIRFLLDIMDKCGRVLGVAMS